MKRAWISVLAGGVLGVALAASGPLAVGSASAPAAFGDVASMMKANDAALVAVKFSLKGPDGEFETEALGVMVDPSGLVLMSNIALGGLAQRLQGVNVSAERFKVLIGDDTEGLDATLVTRDGELGLAWVRIRDPKTTFTAVDLAAGATVAPGDDVYVLARMGKFFDRALQAIECDVTAVTAKPRTLYIPGSSVGNTEFGSPVFNEDGQFVGVLTVILPDAEEAAGPGGMQEALKGVTNGKMILPAADVRAKTAEAKALPPVEPAQPTP